MSSPILPAVQANIDANSTSRPHRQKRYAVLFNEGSGYLLVDGLGHGRYGETALVESLDDHELYVRKLHKPEESTGEPDFKISDEEYTIDHANAPKLMASKYYHTTGELNKRNEQGEDILTDVVVTTSATIWQYCNGGVLQTVFDAWNDDVRKKIPEPVIWHWFAQMLDVHIALAKQGVAHSDNHANNILMHWPEGSEIPDLFLADFGLGRPYPQLQDPQFHTPWVGNYTPTGSPNSAIDSEDTKREVRLWYTSVLFDFRRMLETLQLLLLRGDMSGFIDFSRVHMSQSQQALVNLFHERAGQSARLNGYSAELVQSFDAVSSVLKAGCTQPPNFMANLDRLLIDVKDRADRRMSSFLSRSHSANESTLWLQVDVEALTQTAIWTEDELDSLFTQSQYRPQGQSKYEQLVREQHPVVTISGGGMLNPVDLNLGHYRVVELDYNEARDTWHTVKLVEHDSSPEPSEEESPNNSASDHGNDTVHIPSDSPDSVTELSQGATADNAIDLVTPAPDPGSPMQLDPPAQLNPGSPMQLDFPIELDPGSPMQIDSDSLSEPDSEIEMILPSIEISPDNKPAAASQTHGKDDHLFDRRRLRALQQRAQTISD